MIGQPSPDRASRLPETVEILIAGGHGQVGMALAHAAWPEGVRLYRPSRADLDLTDGRALSELLSTRRIAAVINAAAFTAVDEAETHVGEAFLCNALIPARLADATRRAGVPLIHISTDCVFDGSSARPYGESDAGNPISVYGASKLAGELAVLSAGPRMLVVRTAWVVSARGRNFVRTILQLATRQAELTVIGDVVGSPTAADDLAVALVVLTMAMINDPSAPTGIYHCVNAGEGSWAELAAETVRLSGGATRIVPVPSANRPAAARRPANSRLSSERLERDHGLTMRDWRDALVDVIAQIKRNEAGA